MGELVSASNIQDGTRTIRTARLFTDDCQIENDILYVGRNRDFFPDSSSREIMMIHHNDIISVTSTDLRDTFNRVLSAFDVYNEMEQEMISGIFKSKPEQCILSACEQFLGPTFLLTTDYRTIACSQNYNDRYVNEFWDVIVRSGDLPLELIMQMRNSVSHILALGTPHMIRFVEPHAAPYCYGLICTYWGAEKQVLGHMILSNTRPISKFEEDMAQIILYHLNLIQATAQRSPQIQHFQNTDDVLLSNLLTGKQPQESQEHLRSIHGIPNDALFSVAVCQNSEIQIRHYIRDYFLNQVTSGICICREDEVIVLFWDLCRQSGLPPVLKELAGKTESIWGVSNLFYDLTKLRSYYEHAHFANRTGHSGVMMFHHMAVGYLLNQKIGEYRYYARHPLVLYLENSELEVKRELLDTLQVYLMSERSVKRAAEKLFVHRNTVTYRIDIIRQLGMIDFDDAYDRQYALISLMLTT